MALRTFIAFDIDIQTVIFLDEAVRILRQSEPDESWTKKGNFHLTIKFLGDTSEDLILKLSAELDHLLPVFPVPFKPISFGGFPNIKKPKVLWFGLECEGIEEIAGRVDKFCNKYGFELEDKPFIAHLTLGRIKSLNDFSKIIDQLPTPPKNGFFTRAVFYKSQLTPNGSIYTPLWSKEQNV